MKLTIPILFILIIPILMLSMIAGIFVANALKNSGVYKAINENRLFKSESTYQLLGTGIIRRLIIHSPLKHFNTEIKVEGPKVCLSELEMLKSKMTNAQIGHITGFVLITLTTVLLIVMNQNKYAIITLNILNILFNLYPIFIQEQNKLRVSRIAKNNFS